MDMKLKLILTWLSMFGFIAVFGFVEIWVSDTEYRYLAVLIWAFAGISGFLIDLWRPKNNS